MPHTKKIRYITPLEVQDILDNCYGCDCHLAMMQCIAKGINDLLQGKSKKEVTQITTDNKIIVAESFLGECKT